MAGHVPGKSFSDTELWRSLYKKSLKNKSSVFHSKPIIVKLGNPVSDTICPTCSTKVSVEIPLLPSLKVESKVGFERIGDILTQGSTSSNIKSGKHSPKPSFSNQDADPAQNIKITGVSSLEASFESVSTDEIIHLLPMKSSTTEAWKDVTKSGNNQKKDKHLTLRIKDEMKIDLKHDATQSMTSLLSFKCSSRNKICPIEEVTESSCSSVGSKEERRALKELEEQAQIERISRIIANAITKAKDRPVTRRGWVGECSG